MEESYTYDGVGRVLTRTDKVDNEILTTTYTYNNFDDVTEVVYPSGLQLKYDYDNKGYLRQISNGGTAIFTAIERNGLGQNTSYRLGNGKKTTKEYYHGVPTSYYSVGLQDLEFEWNYASMNLTGRTDNIKGKSEEFTYDGLNRLTGSAGSLGVSTMWTMYEPNGNILAKSDVGRYRYEGSKINAVTWVSNQPLPPDNFPVLDQDVVYTSFYQPLTITEGADKVEFQYGSDDQRIRMRKTKNNVEEYRRYYFGDYELQLEPTHGIVRFIHYISSGNELVAIAERELRAGSSNSEAIHYVYADYLGSILTMTNASGAVEYEQNFDAWGRNRDIVTWNYVPTSLTPPRPLWLYRGYTGHEHLEEFGIVNMNGRLYDPLVSRMFSPDNYVQMPDNLQNYNRYSYVLNNPLSYTDPSGEIIWAPLMIGIIKGAAIGAAIGGVSYTASVALSHGGFSNWEWGQFAKSVGLGAASGVISFGVGTAASYMGTVGGYAFQTAAHGAWGGLNSMSNGGSFWDGALSGMVGNVVAGATAGWNPGMQIGASSLMGGISSRLSGGDFWQGAAIGGIVAGTNHLMHNTGERIAKTAEKYIGSKDWAFQVEKDNFSSNTNKCNKFCYDVLVEAGVDPGLPNGNPIKRAFGAGSPTTASQWADPDYKIKGWKVVNSPKRGDVVAYSYQYSDATGHVAIMNSPRTSVGANSFVIRQTDFGFSTTHLPKGAVYVYRRYVGF